MKKKPEMKKTKDEAWTKLKCMSCGYRLDNGCRRSGLKLNPTDPACPEHSPREGS